MTHTAVHSEFVSMGFNRKRRVSFPHDIYQVVMEKKANMPNMKSRLTAMPKLPP